MRECMPVSSMQMGIPLFLPLDLFVHFRYPWVLRIVSTIALSRQKIAEETKCGWVAMHHNFVCCTDTHRGLGVLQALTTSGASEKKH